MAAKSLSGFVIAATTVAASGLAGCELPASVLNTAGTGAERIADLFWWMAGGAVVIWLVVMAIMLHATYRHTAAHSLRAAHWLIIGGGVIFPGVVLTALLIYALPLMPELRAAASSDLRIAVSGEQWWWRVRYLPVEGEAVELANEVRLPVGKRVAFELSSPDVIHSFWIPALGGKMDLIPGRVNTLVLEPTKPGVYEGICAEYCGTSHALMRFSVVVMEPEPFAQWLEQQAAPARAPEESLTQRGRAAFLANGCGACHTIRGTPADGGLGPDLTHVGSRLTIGAGLLPTEPESFARWIGHTSAMKPDVNMPAFNMLPAEQLMAMAAYLSSLE